MGDERRLPAKAYPYTGEVKSVGYLGASPNGGSIAIGYGRQVFVQTGAGRVMAFTEGWAQASNQPVCHA